MNLQEQGFRYVLRGAEGRWVQPWAMKTGDVDCTDMDDDEFSAAYFFAANTAGEQE